MSRAWRALRHQNFRLFFGGQSISLIGTWMTRIATSWLVYRLTGSALLLGLVGFVGQIPTFLLAPFAGVWVDRLDRRKVLVWTQVLAGLQSIILAILTLAKIVTIREVLILSVFQGLVNAFDMPGRQAFLIEMVEDKKDLGNAIAINSSMVNVARLLGPSLGGLIIAGVGEGYCFLIDAISYVAVIASLLMMHIRPNGAAAVTGRKRPAMSGAKRPSMMAQLREGWDFVSTFVPIRAILLLFAVCSLMGMPYTVLMPIFASKVLHGGPHTLGFLMGAAGCGALVAAVSLAFRRSVVATSAAIFGASLILFGLSHILWLSLLLMVFVGYGMMQGMAASNTIVQTLVKENMRGRVMSYYTMAFVGMAPFGSLLAGALAHFFSAPAAIMFTGSCCVLGALWFTTQLPAMRAIMRPIYVEMGILRPRATD
jgi:MFS family permease